MSYISFWDITIPKNFSHTTLWYTERVWSLLILKLLDSFSKLLIPPGLVCSIFCVVLTRNQWTTSESWESHTVNFSQDLKCTYPWETVYFPLVDKKGSWGGELFWEKKISSSEIVILSVFLISGPNEASVHVCKTLTEFHAVCSSALQKFCCYFCSELDH